MLDFFISRRACWRQQSVTTLRVNEVIMVGMRSFHADDTGSLKLHLKFPGFFFLLTAPSDVDEAATTRRFLLRLRDSHLTDLLDTNTISACAKQFSVVTDHIDRSVPRAEIATRLSYIAWRLESREHTTCVSKGRLVGDTVEAFSKVSMGEETSRPTISAHLQATLLGHILENRWNILLCARVDFFQAVLVSLGSPETHMFIMIIASSSCISNGCESRRVMHILIVVRVTPLGVVHDVGFPHRACVVLVEVASVEMGCNVEHDYKLST